MLKKFFNRLFTKGPLFVLKYYFNVKYMGNQLRRLEVLLWNKRTNLIDRFYFQDPQKKKELRKSFIFHNVTWGEEYLDMLFLYAIPSIMQEGNCPRLKKDGYDIKFFLYTNQSEIKNIKIKYSQQLNKYSETIDFQFFSFESLIKNVDLSDKGPLLQQTFLASIKYCLQNKSSLVNFCSDAFFGNESLYNIAKLAEGKNITIAAAHPRVLYKQIIKESSIQDVAYRNKSITNEELVTLAFKENNSKLDLCNELNDYSMTHHGVSIRKVNEKIYSVIHSLPSPYFLNFTWADYKYFKKRIYNNIDKNWPRMLLKNNRLKIIGSSDIFFMLEFTPQIEDKSKNGNLYNDICMERKNRHLWHYVANSFITTWRMK